MMANVPAPEPRAGFVYTFYSYKGGSGRSMALANIACLLAQGGAKVLVIDWDLEAPGLEKYLRHIDSEVGVARQRTDGVVDLIGKWAPIHDEWRRNYDEWLELDKVRAEARERLRRAQGERARSSGQADLVTAALAGVSGSVEAEWRELDAQMTAKYQTGAPKPTMDAWRNAVVPLATFASEGKLDFISAGRDDEGYRDRVNGLNWEHLFDRDEIGLMLEHLRDEWRAHYDFVLIDSRTGVSDAEGLCTVLLPDALVLLFTTMEQSVQGCIDVWELAVKQRASLPVPRGRLLALPLPSRDETDRENRLANEWHEIFASRFEPIYKDLLPTSMRPIDAVKQLALPYVAAWSFGERLPVVEQARDISNPRSINAAYGRATALLRNRLSWAETSAGPVDIGFVSSGRPTQSTEEHLPSQSDGSARPTIGRPVLRSLLVALMAMLGLGGVFWGALQNARAEDAMVALEEAAAAREESARLAEESNRLTEELERYRDEAERWTEERGVLAQEARDLKEAKYRSEKQLDRTRRDQRRLEACLKGCRCASKCPVTLY